MTALAQAKRPFDFLSIWLSVSSKTNTKVKGNAESTYRTGNVNLTPANIGAVSTDKFIFTRTGVVEFTIFADNSGFEIDLYTSSDRKNGQAVSFDGSHLTYYRKVNGSYSDIGTK